MAIEIIRGVAKPEGVCHDAARKVVKWHENHFFDENHVETRKFSQNKIQVNKNHLSINQTNLKVNRYLKSLAHRLL